MRRSISVGRLSPGPKPGVCAAKERIKDVPDEVREALTAEVRRSGKSLQAYLLGLLEKEARFARNREIVEQTPLPGADLSMDEIVAAVREARGDSGSGAESGAA